jgi:Haem-degrading
VALTLSEANSIVKAAIAKAQELSIVVSVAVCDGQGRVIALNRMEAHSRRSIDLPSAKRSLQQAVGFRAVTSLASSTRQSMKSLERASTSTESVGDCQFFGMVESKADAASIEPSLTRKRKNAPVLASPDFNGRARNSRRSMPFALPTEAILQTLKPGKKPISCGVRLVRIKTPHPLKAPNPLLSGVFHISNRPGRREAPRPSPSVVVVRATIGATIDSPRGHPSPPICHVGFGLILAE